LEFKAREKWDVEFYHKDPYRLRFRELLTGQQFGEWRKVGKKKYWQIERGKTSGLPTNLFIPLNEAIVGSLNKIFRDKRTLPGLRRRTRSTLIHAAAKTFCHCTAEEESKTLIKFILHHKPFIHFLIVDFQEHDPESYALQNEKGEMLKGKWGQPRKDLGKLADEIRKDKSTGLRELEHKSKAVLRWVVCFLSGGTVWLIPAKSRKE
jgi:hypothetical protein